MIRLLLLWASTNPWLSARLPRYGFVRRAVRRFMPGERPEDALREVERLRTEDGGSAILTLLGENVDSEADARAVVDHYLGVLSDIGARGLDAEVSVKLTQLGLDLDPDLALENVRTLVRASAARAAGGKPGGGPLTLWLDMESSAYVDRTLDVYRAVRRDHENVGVALQAYLHRTEDDLASLLPLEPSIRLVKGAYLEPASVAYPNKRDVDGAFHRLTRTLLQERALGRSGRPAIATHDVRLVQEAMRMARELDLEPDAWEFQMLYGIGVPEQQRILARGATLRVLISYGEAWFPWYMRRLAERPANLWFVLRQIVAR